MISKYNIYFLIVIYPLLPLIKGHSLALGNIIEITILFFLFLTMVIHKDAHGWKISIHKRSFFAILLLIAGTLFYLSDFFDTEVYDVFSAARVFFFYIFLIVVLEELFSRREIKSEMLVRIIAAVSIFFAIGAIMQFTSPDIFLSIHTPDAIVELRSKSDFTAFSIFNRVFSFLTDPNIYGVFCAFSLFIIISQYKQEKKSILLFLAIIGNILGMLLSQSRTCLFLLVIFLFVRFLLDIESAKKINLLRVLGILCILGVFVYLIYSNLESVLEYIRVDTILSGNGRVAGSAEKLGYIINQEPFSLLFGNGMGIARDIVFENTYLLLIYQLGIIGFVVFIATAIFMMINNLNKLECIPILVCYLCANYVGDYVLIPQITYIFIISIFIIQYSPERKLSKE